MWATAFSAAAILMARAQCARGAGAAMGVVVNAWSLRAFAGWLPTPVRDLLTTPAVDLRVLAFVAVAALGVATTIAGLVGLLALLVAAVGIHGIIAHSVVRRTWDIAVYLALGAPRAGAARRIRADRAGGRGRGSSPRVRCWP